MMPMIRPAEPPLLTEHGARWTDDYAARKSDDAAHRFRWPEVMHAGARIPLNRYLLHPLLLATAGHCAYCDGFPVGETSRETIDHFRPKGDHPRLAFRWDNLFPACDRCQDEKGDHFDERLLKPDDLTYDFEAYFDFNAKTGALEPNRRATPDDQERARLTMDLFGLNLAARCASRLRHFERHYRDALPFPRADLDTLPYRYLAPPSSD